MDNTKNIRTRMAPSPTGEMHVGSMAVLLKNYAYAKKHGGKFVLRIEDTDKVREVEGTIDLIKQIIHDYGLDWDEGPDNGGDYGPYVQSERLDIYKEKAQELVDADKAYHCFCTRERLEEVREASRKAKKPPKYDRFCRNLSSQEVEEKLSQDIPHVIRLKVPDAQDITFTDLIRGDITVNSDVLDDQVLMKSDGFPTYHLAVIIDDHLMKITHIMRGEEWISSTPKHILLYDAFGWDLPTYAHIPVFLNPDGKGKMSKRKGTVSAQSFLDKGYLPEAMINFFMILGWARKDEREIMTLDEYIEEFDPSRISAKSVVFDLAKLSWINGMYIRNLSQDELKVRLDKFLPEDFPQDKIDDILPLVVERLSVLSDIEDLTSFFYRDFMSDITDEDKATYIKFLMKKGTPELLSEQLDYLTAKFSDIDTWNTENIEKIIRSAQEDNEWHRGQFFMMTRIAVTGRKASPPLFETIEVIGKEKTLERLADAKTVAISQSK